MNLLFGVSSAYAVIIWLGIGAMMGWFAVWIGRETLGSDSQAGPLGQLVRSVLAAIMGVILLRALLGDHVSNTAFLASVVLAFLGVCAVIFVWKRITKKSITTL
jgi:uncharacterized membrane protein YeaQ/YmgE (transglycosylase-associated protein family)